MSEQLPPENPYASPGSAEANQIPAQATWGEGTVTFSFQQTVEDYVAVERFLVQRQSKASNRGMLKHYAGGLLIAIGVFVILFVLPTLPPASPAVGWVMMGLFVAILIGIVVFFLLAKFSGGIAKIVSSAPEEWLGSMRVTVRPEGLETHTADVDAFRRWKSVEEAAETDDYIFLVRKQLVLMSVPKSIFEGAEEAGRVLELIRSYLTPPEPDLS